MVENKFEMLILENDAVLPNERDFKTDYFSIHKLF